MKKALITLLFITALTILYLVSGFNIPCGLNRVKTGETSGETNIAAIIGEIPVPQGYQRTKEKHGSFQSWLRSLPLKKPGAPVLLYNGKRKANQSAHYRVINMDVGNSDLQQCADAVMRLRGEYLYQRKRYDSISFIFTSGHRIPFIRWAEGYRPQIRGNKVKWVKEGGRDYSYQNFRRYMTMIFMYAGTHSLSRELISVPDIRNIQAGDIFIQGGFPGHAVIVVDLAIHRKGKDRIFLLVQSYMPAQELHILLNPNSRKLSPWYKTSIGTGLCTPEWNFDQKDLKRFKEIP